MERSDRRTFLANGLKTGALLAVSGTVVTGAADALDDAAAAAAQPEVGRPGVPGSLSVNGVPGTDRRRPRRRELRLAGDRPPPRGAPGGLQGGRLARRGRLGRGPTTPLWDSGTVHGARQAFLRYGGPGARRRHRVPLVGGDAATRPAPAGRGPSRPPSSPDCGAPTGSPAGFGRGRPGRSPRSTPTCAPWCNLRPAPSCGPPPTWPPPTSSSSGPTGRWPPPAPASPSPTSRTTRPPT